MIKNKRRRILTLITLSFFYTLILKAQSINLSDKENLISSLDKKTFIIADYGEIKFKFDNYNDDFQMFGFDVEYTLYSGKKNKTIKLYTTFPLTYGGFYQPDFFKDISLSIKNETKVFQADFPTRFQLLQNGEFYFLDKQDSYNFQEYYTKSIKNGDASSYVKNKWVLSRKK